MLKALEEKFLSIRRRIDLVEEKIEKRVASVEEKIVKRVYPVEEKKWKEE